jgi:hypothetical protein
MYMFCFIILFFQFQCLWFIFSKHFGYDILIFIYFELILTMLYVMIFFIAHVKSHNYPTIIDYG